MTLVLRAWTEQDDPAVEAFVATHAEGLIYYGPAFRRFLLAVAGGECRSQLAFEGGRLVGVLPLMAAAGPYGPIVNSLPFFGSPGGPLAASPEAELALRDAFGRLTRTAVAANWIAHPFVEVAPPPHTHTDERIAQWTELEANEDALDRRIESSARRNVQKAEAEHVEVREDAGAITFLEQTHHENMAAIGGRTKPPEFFSRLASTMTFGRDWRLHLATRRGEDLAALLTFEAARTVEYIMPVVRASARALQPSAMLLSVAMSDAARRGFTRWNWGGTWLTQDGVYRFKKKWGASERRYRYFVTINDATLLRRTAAELTAAYPSYYVVPFGSLDAVESGARTGHGR